MAKQDVAVELFYSGQWNDHTTDALARDEITITRGRGDEQGGLTPSGATLTFRGWRFNPENVTSDLHGLIGRNTPIRIQVDDEPRFVGEVSSWTPRQSLGGLNQEPDRWVEVEAAGLLRRIGQGSEALDTVLRRYIPTTDPVAYWPFEGGRLASTGPAVAGNATGFRLLPGASAQFGAETLAPWFTPTLQLSESVVVNASVQMTRTPGWLTLDFLRRADAGGSQLLVNLYGNRAAGGTSWFMTFSGLTWNDVEMIVLEDGSFVADEISGPLPALADSALHHVRFQAQQSGSNVNWWIYIDGQVVLGATESGVNLSGVSTVQIGYQAGGSQPPLTLGHMALWDVTGDAPIEDTLPAAFGYQGEHAVARLLRLADEVGLPVSHAGGPGGVSATQPMGPQFPDTLMNQLAEIEAVDDGLLFDHREQIGIQFTTGRRRYYQPAALTLDYAAGQVAPPLEPVVDDQGTRNDVTASRREGGSVRAVDAASVAAIGRTTEQVDLNAMSDELLGDHAGWHLHLGTYGTTRFPRVSVDLDASPELAVGASGVDIGDRIDLANLPAELTPDLASLLVLGYTETIGTHRRQITFNTRPFGPFRIAEVEHAEYSVAGSDGTFVDTEFPAGGTTVFITVRDGHPPWSDADAPFDVVVSGMRLRVTDVDDDGPGGVGFLQSLTVEPAAINGVVKTIAPGADHESDGPALDVFHKSYIGL